MWAGDGIVSLSVASEGGTSRAVTLHTHPDSAAVAEVDGRTISLVALGPYPVADRPTSREAYMACFGAIRWRLTHLAHRRITDPSDDVDQQDPERGHANRFLRVKTFDPERRYVL